LQGTGTKGYWQAANNLLLRIVKEEPGSNDVRLFEPKEISKVESDVQVHLDEEDPEKVNKPLQENAEEYPILFVPESKVNIIATPLSVKIAEDSLGAKGGLEELNTVNV